MLSGRRWSAVAFINSWNAGKTSEAGKALCIPALTPFDPSVGYAVYGISSQNTMVGWCFCRAPRPEITTSEASHHEVALVQMFSRPTPPYSRNYSTTAMLPGRQANETSANHEELIVEQVMVLFVLNYR